MLDADAWPFFTSEPAVLKKFMARNGLEKIVVEVSSAVAKHFDNVPPSVRVVSDPEEGSDHVSIRLPTSMAVDVAYRRFEDFLEQFWVDKHCDAVVVDLEFV